MPMSAPAQFQETELLSHLLFMIFLYIILMQASRRLSCSPCVPILYLTSYEVPICINSNFCLGGSQNGSRDWV